jgi:hypothetical protein
LMCLDKQFITSSNVSESVIATRSDRLSNFSHALFIIIFNQINIVFYQQLNYF